MIFKKKKKRNNIKVQIFFYTECKNCGHRNPVSIQDVSQKYNINEAEMNLQPMKCIVCSSNSGKLITHTKIINISTS